MPILSLVTDNNPSKLGDILIGDSDLNNRKGCATTSNKCTGFTPCSCRLVVLYGAVGYKWIKVTDAERTENLQKMFIW